MDGVRLLSHRPSVLYKVEHLATQPAEGDIAVEGLLLAGPGWDEKLRSVIKALSLSERACLFAVRLSDEQMLPVPAETLLDRTRTDWFPEFLSHGRMHPHFPPIVELISGPPYRREARGCGPPPRRMPPSSPSATARAPPPWRSGCRCCRRARCCSSTSTRARRWT